MSHPPPGAPDPDVEPPPGGCCWRIDDLARRADVPVDTIRYYQRERLLPPGERAGRANLYGAEHLERLERIKQLQERRFSLAAIRALLSREQTGFVEELFSGAEGRSYTLDELVERSGIDRALVDDVRAAGLLRDPAEYGHDAYDTDDLDLLRTLAELHSLGLPRQAVVEIERTYAEGIEATQRRIIELFTTGGGLVWTDAELSEFRDAAAEHATRILPLARRLVDYTHQRTIQRLTLSAIDLNPIDLDPVDGENES
jgi:DNA-binding transcriptional MerR regulator